MHVCSPLALGRLSQGRKHMQDHNPNLSHKLKCSSDEDNLAQDRHISLRTDTISCADTSAVTSVVNKDKEAFG